MNTAEPLPWQRALKERIHILGEDTSSCLFVHTHTLAADIVPDLLFMKDQFCVPITLLAPEREQELLARVAVVKGVDVAKFEEAVGRKTVFQKDDFNGIAPKLRAYAYAARPQGFAFALTPEEELLRDQVLHMACTYPQLVRNQTEDAYLVDALERKTNKAIKNYRNTSGGSCIDAMPIAGDYRHYFFLGGARLRDPNPSNFSPERIFLEETIHGLVTDLWRQDRFWSLDIDKQGIAEKHKDDLPAFVSKALEEMKDPIYWNIGRDSEANELITKTAREIQLLQRQRVQVPLEEFGEAMFAYNITQQARKDFGGYRNGGYQPEMSKLREKNPLAMLGFYVTYLESHIRNRPHPDIKQEAMAAEIMAQENQYTRALEASIFARGGTLFIPPKGLPHLHLQAESEREVTRPR